MNLCILMGRLVAAPELRRTPNGVSTCTVRLAVERDYTPKGEERKSDFIDVVAWRQTAEFLCRYFTKGSMLAVQGTLQTRSYEDKNGNKRTAFEVVADRAHFTGEKAGTVQPGESAARSFAPASGKSDVEKDEFTPIESDEDMPF